MFLIQQGSHSHTSLKRSKIWLSAAHVLSEDRPCPPLIYLFSWGHSHSSWNQPGIEHDRAGKANVFQGKCLFCRRDDRKIQGNWVFKEWNLFFSEVGGARPGKASDVCNRHVVCGFNIKMHILALEQLFSLTPCLFANDPSLSWSVKI